MSFLIFVFFFCFQSVAQADFSISVELEEPSAISSGLTFKGKVCVGTNQKTEIKHETKVCERILRDYKSLLETTPETLPPGSDEPTALIKFSSDTSKWNRLIGRVSGDSPENQKLKLLTNEILKLNAK